MRRKKSIKQYKNDTARISCNEIVDEITSDYSLRGEYWPSELASLIESKYDVVVYIKGYQLLDFLHIRYKFQVVCKNLESIDIYAIFKGPAEVVAVKKRP